MHHLLSFLFFLAVPPQDQPSSPSSRPVLAQPPRHVVPSPTSRPTPPVLSKKTTPVASPKGPSSGPSASQKGPSSGSSAASQKGQVSTTSVGSLKKSKAEAFLPASMLRRDPQVKVLSLSTGLLSWCYASTARDVLRLRVAVAAGATTDPRKLRGQARLLSKLLAYRLSRPENPAKSPLAVGGARYHVTLQKDWVLIDALAQSASLGTILGHIAQRLQESPLSGVDASSLQQIRSELMRSSARFPAASLEERMDAYFYAEYPRGSYLRGQRRTYQTITPAMLVAAHKALYRAERVRVLMVGELSCEAAFSSVRSAFEKLAGKGPAVYPTEGAPENLVTSRRGRMFLTQDLLLAYLLPPLRRKDVLPLDFLLYVGQQELERSFLQRFSEIPQTKRIVQPYPQSGYVLWLVPMPAMERPEVDDLLRKALGGLLMDPYDPPALVGHLETYRKEAALSWAERMGSAREAATLLWSQMRLPSSVDYAYDWRVLSDMLKTSEVRDLARRYLRNVSMLRRGPEAFSMQRVVLLVGSLLMLWFFLDLMIRRARRTDD